MTAPPMRGLALAGGGPLGAIYEIGALVALQEALPGLELTECSVYVGVSSGSFLAAGLANGLTPRAMHRMFIESEEADDPFEPELLLRPALREYAGRLAGLPRLLASALRSYGHSARAGWFESFGRLARALPVGVFDNAGVARYLARLLEDEGRSNDFRELARRGRRLFLVATDVDRGEPVAFGSPGWDHVPISQAVQASAALPGLFPPVRIEGRDYADGALTKTLHASVALRAGAQLLLCVNPLVPFDAVRAAARGHRRSPSIIEGGLPAVLSQTFRTLIYSRMRAGMERYRREFPDADLVLFEPERDDPRVFFTNVFSYADRRRLCEHAYQGTRAQLRRRRVELSAVFARHGLALDEAVLDDGRRSLMRGRVRGQHLGRLGPVAQELERTLDRLQAVLATRPPGP